MTATRYDAIVVGVGAMGSAALFHLARRGKRVLGLERFDVPNAVGSSHGVTRIIRKAYFEHPDYVPLLERAYELWRELQAEAGERLLRTNGCLTIAAPDAFPIAGALCAAREHDLDVELLEPDELVRRYPVFRPAHGHVGLLERDGGYLLSERCVAAHAAAALARGADIRARERVLDWEETSGALRVRTDRGAYEAERLVVTAGAWAAPVGKLRPELFVPELQVLGWFHPRRPEPFTPERFPVFIALVEEGFYYGFPVVGVPGVKVGLFHHRGERVDPDAPRREPDLEDERLLRACLARYLPDANGTTTALATCLFEVSPDEHFLIGPHPDCAAAIVAAGFSGHGFKFASVVGEALAELVAEGATRHPIGFLALDRLPEARIAGAPER